ncbi:hypothetical protein PanWU01x14_364180 [Parasponia andersonii]|uniref:DC1 domain-containing protein n=1 Tax=Parasponia andersonii TaxID=3476 RepID=A0A2P5A6E6_PARAD|nr:hypothetical protein PanWU01x14_364180 [Parasponia andersonii]
MALDAGFIVIGPSGQTITRNPGSLLMFMMDEMAKRWHKKLKHELHDEHEFSLTHPESVYCCNGCLETGIGWYFKCEQCYFSLHPKCALKKHEEANDDPKGNQGILL